MRRLYESLLAFFGGGQRPWHVGLSVMLGLTCGFVFGWNMTFAALLLLALAVNARTRTLGQCLLLGMGLGWLLTPVSYQLGYLLLEKSGVGDHWSGVGVPLFVVLLDCDRPVVVGGALLGIILAVPTAWLAMRTARRLHARLASLSDLNSSQDQPRLRGFAGLACWCLYGSLPQAVRIAATPRKLGKLRCLAVVTAIAAAGLIYYFQGAQLLGRRLLARIATANEADAEAGSIEFQLLENKVVIRDLRLADPEHLDRDRLRAAQVTAHVDSATLLRGQAHIEKLLLNGLRFDSTREQRAKSESLNFSGFSTLPAHDPQVSPSREAGLPLSQYVQGWKTIEADAARLRALITRLEDFSERDASTESEKESAPGFAPLSYAAMRQFRFGAKQEQPNVSVVQLRASGLPAEWKLGDDAALEITNLCSHAKQTGEPTVVVIDAPDLGADMTLRMELHKASRQHKLQARAVDVDLAEILQTPAARRVAIIQKGSLVFRGTGKVTRDRIELPVMLQCEGITAEVAADQRPGGISAAAWNEGLRRVNRLQVTAAIEGNWKSPLLTVNPWTVIESWKRDLSAAGESKLVSDIERQLAANGIASAADMAETDKSRANEYDAPLSQSPNYEADPLTTTGNTEQGTSMSDRGLNWRAKGSKLPLTGRTSSEVKQPCETDKPTGPDRYAKSDRTDASPSDTHATPSTSSVENPTRSNADAVATFTRTVANTSGGGLQYPKTVHQPDRASERKLSAGPSQGPSREVDYASTKPVVIQGSSGPRSQGASIRALPDTEIVQNPAAKSTKSDDDSTSERSLPGGLGFDLGYDGADKKKSDRAVKPATGSSEIVDASNDHPVVKQLPNQLNGRQDFNAAANSPDQVVSNDGNGDAPSGFDKFTNSVSNGFKKMLPAKRDNAAGNGNLAGQPRQSRNQGSRGIFSSRQNPQGNQPLNGQNATNEDPTQANGAKPWYKFWR